MDWYADAVRWMVVNEKLAGWAQAIGSVVAILIAIAVPAWQRHAERRDAAIEDARIDVVLSQNLFFLLRDVAIFLKNLISRKEMPRKNLADRVSMDDLLSRIAALESRERHAMRILALFRTRGALSGTNMALVDWLGETPLTDTELDLLKERVDLIEGFFVDARRNMHEAMDRHRRVRVPILLRPFARVVRIAKKHQRRLRDRE